MADAEAPVKKSDLKVRVLSAVVMVAIVGAAIWWGGKVWAAFVALVALGLFWEFFRLVMHGFKGVFPRFLWTAFAVFYIFPACILLIRTEEDGRLLSAVFPILAAVVATDVGAYFVGRSIGGPKLAPRISPGKTWSGLIGGALAAGLVFAWFRSSDQYAGGALSLAILGTAMGVVAQAGDLFESWLKRRAGLKDSGNLIPGHGGLFDRLDGMLAVLFFVVVTLIASEYSASL